MTSRISRLATVSALALALLLPGTVSAAYAPFRSVVLKASCTNSGGVHGFGKVVLKVEALSYGEAGTNYFVFKTKRQEKIDGIWVTVDKIVTQSAVYPDTAGLFSAANKVKYQFPSALHPKTRLLTQIQFWDERPGDDVRLAVHGHRTAGC